MFDVASPTAVMKAKTLEDGTRIITKHVRCCAVKMTDTAGCGTLWPVHQHVYRIKLHTPVCMA
jgi:hypothetical protein